MGQVQLNKIFRGNILWYAISNIYFWLRMPQIRFLFSFKNISTIFECKTNCLTLCGPTEKFTTQLKLSEFRKENAFFFVQIASKPASVSSFFAMCAGEKPTRMLKVSKNRNQIFQPKLLPKTEPSNLFLS